MNFYPNKRIVYSDYDNSVRILIPCLNHLVDDSTGELVSLNSSYGGEAPEGFHFITVEEIAARDVPMGRPWQIVDVAGIPEDRSLRDAWEYPDV